MRRLATGCCSVYPHTEWFCGTCHYLLGSSVDDVIHRELVNLVWANAKCIIHIDIVYVD